MRWPIHPRWSVNTLIAGAAAVAAAGGIAYATTGGSTQAARKPVKGTIYACVAKRSGAMTLSSARAKCRGRKISWNAAGARGPAGPQGQAGARGATGATGATGAQGSAGAQGNPGTNGTNGTNGNNGAPAAGGFSGRVSLGNVGQSFNPTDEFVPVTGVTSSTTMIQSNVQSLSPAVAMTVENLEVRLDNGAGGFPDKRRVSVMVGGSEVLGCDLTGFSSPTTCTASGPATVPAGSLISVRIETNSSSTIVQASPLYWGFRATS